MMTNVQPTCKTSLVGEWNKWTIKQADR